VARKLYVVFSSPPDGVTWDEYNAWYDLHARENVQTPHFVGVTRYEVERIVLGNRVDGNQYDALRGGELPEGTNQHRHLAVFEFDGDIADVREHLLGRVASGEIVLPEWFDRVTFETFSATPLDERIEPVR
jgi:hypothetical protein